MTRDQKIEALAEEYEINCPVEVPLEGVFKAGVLAGIALRDAELLEKLGTFDHKKIDREMNKLIGEPASENEIHIAYWQHEQMIRAIKGDGE